MRRICNSTPFRLDEIDKARPEAIREAIDAGIPIIWFVPGHARLLIGLHPENNEIVYSDSWGIEHQYKTASWDYFINYNQEMWILEPPGLLGLHPVDAIPGGAIARPHQFTATRR